MYKIYFVYDNLKKKFYDCQKNFKIKLIIFFYKYNTEQQKSYYNEKTIFNIRFRLYVC